MKYLHTLLFCLVFMVGTRPVMRAQTADSAFGYFPMQIGNRWVYDCGLEIIEPEPGPCLTREITADTIMPNGYRYWKLVDGPFVPTSPFGFYDTSYLRIDSLTGELKRYSKTQHRDVARGFPWGAPFWDTYERLVFGSLRPVRVYWGVTTAHYYAYGIGPTYWERPTYPMPDINYNYTLLYAKVNGVEYGTLSDVEENGIVRRTPDPIFNVSTAGSGSPIFSFTFSTPSPARITLVDISGRTTPILDREYSAGAHRYIPPSLDLPNGFYIAVLKTDRGVTVKRVMIAR